MNLKRVADCMKLAAGLAKLDNDAAECDPWSEGYDAYRVGRSDEDCPYSSLLQGEQWHQWTQGWLAAYRDKTT